MNPKIEVTYVLRSGQGKSFLSLENALLRMLDNYPALTAHTDYTLEMRAVNPPVDTGMEHRLILSLTADAWNAVSAVDLIEIAMTFNTILLARDLGRPVTEAFLYRVGPAGDPAEQVLEEYIARNYGNGLVPATMFLDTTPPGYLKPEVLEAFYDLQDASKSILVDEPSPESKIVVCTVDLTDEGTKKRIKDSLGIRNSACDLTAVTVNPVTSEVTYTVKSALWGEKEHKVVRNDLHTWPLIIKEEN